MKLQRSQQKKITRDARILRHMRISRKISLNEAGKKVRISGSAIAHIEQGRMDISRARLDLVLKRDVAKFSNAIRITWTFFEYGRS